jgi:hypothetical protein
VYVTAPVCPDLIKPRIINASKGITINIITGETKFIDSNNGIINFLVQYAYT